MERNEKMHTFRPHVSYGATYIETETRAEIGLELKKHAPAGTIFRSVKLAGDDFYTVLRLSQYTIGPVIAGYYRSH